MINFFGVSFMGIFEEIYVKTKTALGIVSDKAGQLVGISKLKIVVAECEGERRREFENLGRTIYHAKKRGNIDSVDIESCVSEIDALGKKIEDVKREIDELKRKATCGVCKEKVDKDSYYCRACGARLNNDPQDYKNRKKSDCDSKVCDSEDDLESTLDS